MSLNDFELLEEKDYISILDVVGKFNQCQSRKQIKTVFESQLLPLFNSKHGLYALTDAEISGPNIVDAVNIPEGTIPVFEKFVSYDELSKSIHEKGRPVLAHDVDLSRDTCIEGINRFFRDHPEISRDDHPYFDNIWGALVALEFPYTTMGFAVHRTKENISPITYREVRMMELLQPHVINALKAVWLREELGFYENMTEILANTKCPTVFVSAKYQILFQNKSFRQLFKLSENHFLPDELTFPIERGTGKIRGSLITGENDVQKSFVKKDGGLYYIEVMPVLEEKESVDSRWLIRLKPALEPFSKVYFQFQNAGLTKREKEVCMLIKEGLRDKAIASRLFISPHTVEVHLKNIYRKMKVKNRTELIFLILDDVQDTVIKK